MECPNCKIKMVEGMVENNVFTEGFLGKTNKSLTWTLGMGKRVIAYRCSKCGKVEFYAEEKKE